MLQNRQENIQAIEINNNEDAWIAQEVNNLVGNHKERINGKLKDFPMAQVTKELQTTIDNALTADNVSIGTKEKFKSALENKIENEKYQIGYFENRFKQTSNTAKLFFAAIATITIPVVFDSTNMPEKWVAGLIPFFSGALIAKIDHDNYAELWEKKTKILMLEGINIDKIR